MPDDFNQPLCDEKHGDLERRVENLEKIAEKMYTRLPLWATFYITGTTSLVVGLGVFLLTKGHI
jgi:hypothetical protein